jgi:hypothetical protein
LAAEKPVCAAEGLRGRGRPAVDHHDQRRLFAIQRFESRIDGRIIKSMGVFATGGGESNFFPG